MACGVRQGPIEGPVLANIYIGLMIREVLSRCLKSSIRIRHRLDGRWLDMEDMTHGQRIACLMCAAACARFASSGHEPQQLYDESQEVSTRGGMRISLDRTEASAYRAWVSATGWLGPQVIHLGGTLVKGSTARRHLGQVKGRRGATQEIDARIGSGVDTWRGPKGETIRTKPLPVQLRIRLYGVLATSKLLSAIETTPLTTAEQRRLEVSRASHLRRIQFVPYRAHCPNGAVRRSAQARTVESKILVSRFSFCGLACRDSPRSFFRASPFGRVVRDSPKKRPHHTVTPQQRLQTATQQLGEHLKLRGLSLDPDLFDAAEMARRTYYHSGPEYTWQFKKGLYPQAL